MFERVLAKCGDYGRLTLLDHRGRRHEFHAADGPTVTIRVHDAATDRRLTFNPWLAIGEAYMDRRITIEEGSLYDLIDIAMTNQARIEGDAWAVLMRWARTGLRWWHQNNPIGLARQHVAHHYDLSRRLFELFLDPSLQYSCAYFARADATLVEAQQAKMRHIAAKLFLEKGQRVLDIGCGWGGLALYLARAAGVEVVGVTLSKEQCELATERAKASGLDNLVSFKLQDYRLETGLFDRVVSVGMFEHVGLRHFPEFFQKVEEILKPGGVALLHSIGRRDGPGATNPWVRKYIFPGGYAPALSEVVPVVEKTGLWISDIEILRLHYAETLRHWRANFAANRAEIAKLFDERFCRMWEFYLTGSELTFRQDHTMVFQMQLCRGIAGAPATRDYMMQGKWGPGVSQRRPDSPTPRRPEAA